MIRQVVKDVMILSRKSVPAEKQDIPIGKDLLDTLFANAAACVGMAANMIGINKRIIVVNTGVMNIAMFNPVIESRSGRYETQEGCLSLSGLRPTVRYQSISVSYMDINWKKQKLKLTGWPAQIVQHEIDHCDGIVI
ncbi:MAG: peptide deformylase [Bulleidia sp.]|nr:peptide deformylase [Erysipelotrichaceae bacterium]MDD6662851.1 peptide deformylase [Bulleidia sp.]MDY4809825.1 peptide deformylase [Bulleidia sp.]HAW12784.1 peptide deformylase [Erysipelotrichaceae bacterium]